jgi:cytochrome bd-type quinol oxidase subunit 2
LLLLFPSFIAAYVVRPWPHRLTVRMLRAARWVVGSVALLPFVAAGFLALSKRDQKGQIVDEHFAAWWLAFAALATVLAGILVGARFFPLPALNARRIAARLPFGMSRRYGKCVAWFARRKKQIKR